MRHELKHLPLLAAATKAELERLERAASVIAAIPGEALFPAFTPTDTFWLLLAGRWRVLRRVAGREALMFEADRPGTWTGGVPVIYAIAPVRAEVLAPSRFARLPIAAMEATVAGNPRVARHLLEALEWAPAASATSSTSAPPERADGPCSTRDPSSLPPWPPCSLSARRRARKTSAPATTPRR